jgi:hypothetical protein
MGVQNALLGQGVGEASAEQWLIAWEAEGRSRGIDARTSAFWEESRSSIEDQRGRPYSQ